MEIDALSAETAAAIGDLNAMCGPDGPTIRLLEHDIERRVLRLRVDLSEVECVECVLPTEVLTDLAGSSVRRSLGPNYTVVLSDPRAERHEAAS